MRTPLMKQPAAASRVEGRGGRGHPGADAHYTYKLGGHELTLIRREVIAAEVTAVGRGEAEFALVVDDLLVWLCYRFGAAIPWGAALYERDVGTRGKADLPPTAGGPSEGRALLHVTLADADGTPRATRNIDLRLDFTRALHGAIREQSRVSFDPPARRRALEQFLRRYPSVDVMVAHAMVRNPACT